MPQAITAAQAGTIAASTSTMPAIPAATSTNPLRTSGVAPTRRIVRSWIHAPVDHATVPAVSAIPDRSTLSPRSDVTVSGTYTSAPKKANVRRPRASTAEGRPARARRVPAGRSRRSAGTPRARPNSTSAGETRMSRA